MYAKFTLSRQLSAIILFIHMKYKPLDCLAFGPDWKKSSIVLLDILMIFQPFLTLFCGVK